MTDIIEREPIKVLADIIQAELGLEDWQLMLYNQRTVAPTEDGLYVYLSLIGPGKIIANNNYQVPSDSGMTESQQLLVAQQIQVDVLSQNSEARTRCFEVLMALQSMLAEQTMEKYQMRISKVPSSFVDTSEVEGAARLNRYTLTMVVNCKYTKEKAADYYGTFDPVAPVVH
jgi:hypothetical protein